MVRPVDGEAQGDVRHLADGGVRQMLLDVALDDRHGRAVDDREPRQQRQRQADAEGGDELGAEHVLDEVHQAEGAGLHHRHGVQQGAHWRRRHHRAGQPGVQREEGRLDAHADEEERAGALGVGEVGAGAGVGLTRFLVHHQRPGGQG